MKISHESNLIAVSLVELWAQRVLSWLEGKGIIEKRDGGYILRKPHEIASQMQWAVNRLIEDSSKNSEQDLFSLEPENSFFQEYRKYQWSPHALSCEISDFVASLTFARDDIRERKLWILKGALHDEWLSLSDQDIKDRIQYAKRLIKEHIAPHINTQSKQGYHQTLENLWNSEIQSELRKYFPRKKLYHMFLDLAEFFMKRHLPRIVMSKKRSHHTWNHQPWRKQSKLNP